MVITRLNNCPDDGTVLTELNLALRFEQMALYLSFPVTMFWISNQAEYFEEYVVKRKVSNVLFNTVYGSNVLYSVWNAVILTNLFFSIGNFYGIQRELSPRDEELCVSSTQLIKRVCVSNSTQQTIYHKQILDSGSV